MRILILLFVFNICVSNVFSQNFKNYISASTGINSAKQPGFSLEAGRWGMKSSFTFGLDVDLNYNSNFTASTVWAGPKLYYSVYQKEQVSCMIYTSFKFALNAPVNTDNFLLENGITLNYNLSENNIISLAEYFQSSKSANLIPNLGIGFVKLF